MFLGLTLAKKVVSSSSVIKNAVYKFIKVRLFSCKHKYLMYKMHLRENVIGECLSPSFFLLFKQHYYLYA